MKKIVIDAGHGGDDPGAIGNNITEKNYNLEMSNYIYNRLKNLGFDVKMTRTTDETLTPTERVNRVKNAFGNSKDVILISNHINAGGGDGAEVIYALRNTNKLSDLILDELEKEGQNIRKAYQRRLPSNTSKDYYFMQRDTGDIESITVEYGFLDSTDDDVEQLKNNLEEYGEAVVRAVATYAGVPYTTTNKNYYVVQKGDSLWSISKKYNMTVNELKELNNLTSNNLKIGQTLKVKNETTTSDNNNYYIVKKGDSLWSISKNNNMTVNELKELNNLTSNNLKIGQKLKLKDNDTYVVQKGDSLWSISKKYNTTVSKLKELNNLTNNLINVGNTLKIK